MVISYLDIVHPTSGHQNHGKNATIDPLDFGAPYSQKKMIQTVIVIGGSQKKTRF